MSNWLENEIAEIKKEQKTELRKKLGKKEEKRFMINFTFLLLTILFFSSFSFSGMTAANISELPNLQTGCTRRGIWVCPQCGYENYEGINYCPICGTERPY